MWRARTNLIYSDFLGTVSHSGSSYSITIHRNRSRNTESTEAGLLSSLRRLWRHWASCDASDARSTTVRTEFGENVTDSSVVDATSRDVRVQRSSWLGQESWGVRVTFNPLNPVCYLLALLGDHHFLHVSRIRVKLLTFRLLMSYIYGAPILDVSRSHTTTQHSR